MTKGIRIHESRTRESGAVVFHLSFGFRYSFGIHRSDFVKAQCRLTAAAAPAPGFSQMPNAAFVFLQKFVVVVIAVRIAADINLRRDAAGQRVFDSLHDNRVDDEDRKSTRLNS